MRVSVDGVQLDLVCSCKWVSGFLAVFVLDLRMLSAVASTRRVLGAAIVQGQGSCLRYPGRIVKVRRWGVGGSALGYPGRVAQAPDVSKTGAHSERKENGRGTEGNDTRKGRRGPGAVSGHSKLPSWA